MQKATPWGNSIWEFSAYGLPADGKQDISFERSLDSAKGEVLQPIKIEDAFASSVQPESFNWKNKQSENFIVKNAIDNNLRTRWSSMHEDPQWLLLDLGAIKEFNEIRIVWETAHASIYKIEVSENKMAWKDIYSTENGDGKIDAIMLKEPIKARYIRLTGLKRATKWGFSLWEFWVF
ncbi:MAG: discoidin domain-containing protein [Candidatus Theseobacter exili]|nr:discoidin domain-containing protein [Candidatus Theseobacter exili]